MKNKLGKKLLDVALKKALMTPEQWSTYVEILKYRKQAKGTALVLGMAETRFHGVENLNRFFDNMLTSDGIYSLRRTRKELAYLWQAWKHAVKSIRNRKQFTEIFEKGVNVTASIREAKNAYRYDKRMLLRSIEVEVSGSKRLSFCVHFKNEERIYFYKSVTRWIMYYKMKNVTNDMFENTSSWRPKEISIEIDKGKVTLKPE